MNFSDRLNEYIKAVDVSNKELSELSGISAVSVWRYRSGTRTPKRGSREVQRLAKGLAGAAKKGGVKLSEKEIASGLNATLASLGNSRELVGRLKLIMRELDISIKEISDAMQYDPSFLSKVLRGKLELSNPDTHVAPLAAYLASENLSENKRVILCRVVGCDVELISDSARFGGEIYSYLTADKSKALPVNEMTGMQSFVRKLDEFDLEDYISAIHFNDIIVPTSPLQIPRSKYYTGIEAMKSSEMDFITATVLSRSKEPVFSYSDMPLKEMSNDASFAKKYMMGLAMMIKKGLHINMLHDVSRPFEEMMIGLEGFIPLYMTGQISPFYLSAPNGELTHLLLKVSGAGALHGEAICGYHAKGRYYFSTKKDDIRYYKLQSELMLKKSKPLMDIYSSDRREEFESCRDASFKAPGERKHIFSSLPLAAISDELLEKMIKRNGTATEQAELIRKHALKCRRSFEELLTRERVTFAVPEFSKSTLESGEVRLWFPELFLGAGLTYTAEEYTEHLELTKRYAEQHPLCTLLINDRSGFKNIDITVIKGTRVIVSKAKSPTIHFVIDHPRMVEAFENFSVPVIEDK